MMSLKHSKWLKLLENKYILIINSSYKGEIPMANYRAGRVKQEIQREVNDILSKRIKDPRVQNVTITDVDLTGDLQNATIYYSTLQELASERENIQLGLEKATGLIRKELGSRLTLYRTPELVFKRDESIDYGNKIEELIRQIHDEDETK